MSEFIITSDVAGGIVHSGHQTKRVLKGGVSSVRDSVVMAIERLGYSVLSSDPVRAKRRAATSAVDKLTRSSITITVGLREMSQAATQATFDYEVASSSMYRGDHSTIEREVDAIAALVSRQGLSTACAGCGNAQDGESPFCRACGLRNALAEPVELDLLRVEGSTRYGHRANITGISLMLIALLVGVPLIFFGAGKAISVGWALLVMGQVSGLFCVLLGSYVVHKTLNPGKVAETPQFRAATSVSFPSPSATEGAQLSAFQTPPTVTEGTTELLPTPVETTSTST